ncbi:ABC-2 family transporter protein [Nodosilinea sp. LEGE 07088]|uniref:ABC transporter permease n=1 Tax=Nodosilinea sp. LEGE 07088 TaxID=2777968 RepID=UPI001882ED14|nr:ABC-2 family transporter protein [Nodosilinea sp. LEGE 07088]
MLSVYYAYMVEYRAELVFWVLSGTFPLILMGLWVEAAQGDRFDLTPTELVQYFLAVFLVRQFTVVWVIWEFEREVVEGRLSPYLLQPIDPVWRHFFSHVSERFARLPFAILLVGLFLLLYPYAAWLPSLGNLVLGLLAIVLAFCLRFLMQYTFALAAFWTERASALEQFWFLLYTFLSGMVAPLALFPDAVRAVVLWTPFPYLIYFPASLLINRPENVAQGFMAMILWLALFWGLNRWLWRQGLKQYSGMGA